MRKLPGISSIAAVVVVACLSVGVTAASGATPPSASAAPAAHQQSAQAPVRGTVQPATWSSYRVPTGVTFNNANGSHSAQYAISDKLIAAIDHAKYKSWIRIMSWNVMSSTATTHLLAAQRRGVYVRVLMDAGNSSREVPNPQWRRLQAGLASGNHRSYHYGNSAARVCRYSCRGRYGQAHSKYYLFSQSGVSSDVVMEGSANLTNAAATNQWNDLFTFVGGAGLYAYTGKIFEQMWNDRPVTWSGGPYEEYVRPSYSLEFTPGSGSNFHGFPTSNLLANKTIRCKFFTTGTATRRTVIRLFPDAMRDSRGLRDAYLLKGLWDRGCDVRVAYTLLSVEAHAVLARGGPRGRVPMRHVVTDGNHDGQFEKYFHLKVLTFNGKVNDKITYKAVEGSSNLSGLSSASDENIGIFTTPRLVMSYQHWLDYWWYHAPHSVGYLGGSAGRGTAALRTTTGAPAVAPDGYIAPGTEVISPTTGRAVDPYALIDRD